MQKRSHIETSALIVFLSILTILIQFAAYYFFASIYIILGIACLVTIVCSHILLEQTLSFESCFIYDLLILFISVVITFLTYFGNDNNIFPYTNILLWLIVINWLIPTLHCYLRNMLEYGNRIEDFTAFFRNSSILFNLFYLGILLYASFAGDAFPWMYRAVAEKANLTPFWSIATQIEDYMNHMIPLGDIITYLASRILLFFPYGYYSILLLRRRPRFVRFLALLLFPVILELLQFFLYPTRCDIDDVIYALIGGLLGASWFHLNNVIFRAVSGKAFLAKDTDFRYSKSSLHF
jgi:hypothetical protein